MKFSLTPPVIGFIVGTRAALGVGIGLLLADRFSRNDRRKLAASLIAFGAATTIPAVMKLLAIRSRADDKQLMLGF